MRSGVSGVWIAVGGGVRGRGWVLGGGWVLEGKGWYADYDKSLTAKKIEQGEE